MYVRRGVSSYYCLHSAHAQRGLTYFFRQLFWHCRLRNGLWAIPTASELRGSEYKKYPITIAFERFGVKTSEKPICIASPRPLWKRHQNMSKGQVVSHRLHSNATYEYNYPIGARNDRLWARGKVTRGNFDHKVIPITAVVYRSNKKSVYRRGSAI